MKGFLRSGLFFLLVVIFSFWVVSPLFHPGFFPMHDDTQVSRVYEMAKALSESQFPVRWVGDLGYGSGYPLFNFYAPLPYYVGAIFVLIGFDALLATKIMFFIGIVLAGITMFSLLDNLVGRKGALIGSLLYMYAPYHAVDIYVRGAVGEFYAYAFLPLILLGVVKIINDKRRKELNSSIILGSFGIAGVFLSHNILGMITGYFLGIGLAIYLFYLLISKKSLATCYLLLATVMLGIGLSAFFLLPAIFEKNFTRVSELISGGSQFTSHFIFLDQLWSSPWGYAGSAPGRLDGMSFMLGKTHLILGLLSIPVVLFLKKRKKINIFQLFILPLLIFSASVFFMLDTSKFLWDFLPGFAYIQYPWRFLVYAVLSLSMMASVILTIFKKSLQIILGIVIIGSILWFNSKYFVPNEYLPAKVQDYTSQANLHFKISKISDEYLPVDFVTPNSPQDIAGYGLESSSNLEVIKATETFTQKAYEIIVAGSNLYQTNITYFPGWQAKIDGKSSPIYSRDGKIVLSLPAGQHSVEFAFGNTPIRSFSNTISIFSLFLVVYIIVFKRHHEKIFG